MSRLSLIALAVAGVAVVVLALGARGVLTAPDSDLPWSVFGSGGGVSTSTNYEMGATAGQAGPIGEAQSASYGLRAGFWSCAPQDSDCDGAVNVTDVCPNDPNNDGDSDGICVGNGFQSPKTGDNDNCPDTANAGQENFDGDALGDACDPDDDNDLIGDAEETACGANGLDAGSIPERVDGIFSGVDDDGNDGADEALPGGASAFDCDGDGYTGAAEDHVYSYIGQLDGDQKTCQEYDTNFTAVDPNQTAATPSLRWPPDFNSVASPLDSFNRLNILDIVSFLAPVKYFGTDLGTNPGDVRWDLTPGKGVFLTDINVQDITAMIAGSSGSPPMLGGAKALFGPVCPGNYTMTVQWICDVNAEVQP